MKYQLKIIVSSTRPNRKGHLVADWFFEIAQHHTNFEIEILDLKEINLPFFNESEHPRLQKYAHAHTQKWSQSIQDADAFVVVTPEYNHSYPAPLKNALDYLSVEWQEKPMGLVGYGGVSAGTRALQDLIIPVTTLGMMPLPQTVNIPFFTQFINNNGVFEGNETVNKSANIMLDKLEDWTVALKGMREKTLID